MSKNQITPKDKEIIEGFNKSYEKALTALDKAKQLSVGDFLILYVTNHEGKLSIQKNTYGAPVKYKVVYVSKQGMPFMKKVNKKGNTIGHVYSCMGTLESDDFSMGMEFSFELDPDFADSLLLQDQYDPATLHKSKRDIWKAVTEHNKACKVDTSELKHVITFFNTVNPGDTLWMSNLSHLLVRDAVAANTATYNQAANWKYRTRQKGPLVKVLTVVDKKGKIFDITADYFLEKALYKERPRTYKELNI